MTKHNPELKFAVAILISAARQAYGDDATTPANVYRFSVSPDGSKLEVMKSGLDWVSLDISTKGKK